MLVLRFRGWRWAQCRLFLAGLDARCVLSRTPLACRQPITYPLPQAAVTDTVDLLVPAAGGHDHVGIQVCACLVGYELDDDQSCDLIANLVAMTRFSFRCYHVQVLL